MKTIRLGDYIDLLTDYHAGGSYKTLKEKTKILYTPDYAVFVRTLNFEQSKFDTDLIYCDKSSYDFLSYSHLKENDILINKIANPGSVYIMPKVDYLATCAMNLFLLRFKNINQRYIYYVMKNSESYIKKQAHGTATKTITKDDVRNLNFLIHGTKEEQNRVERILSNIDRKIEINNKLNKELERVAKTLYNYWFVQFDFPDGNKRPYKSSGGKMVYNATLKREIPEGWNVLNLGERLNFEKGIEPGTDNYIENPTDLVQYMKFYRVGDMDDSGTTYLLKNEYKDAPVLNPYDLVVSFDGSVGRLSFGLTGMYSSGIRRITDKLGILDASTICFIFQNPHIQAIIHKYATGSNILHAGSAISHLTIAYNENVFLKYQSIIKPLYAKLVENKKEISHLTKLRDFLLPMLMNGQVTVNS